MGAKRRRRSSARIGIRRRRCGSHVATRRRRSVLPCRWRLTLSWKITLAGGTDCSRTGQGPPGGGGPGAGAMCEGGSGIRPCAGGGGARAARLQDAEAGDPKLGIDHAPSPSDRKPNPAALAPHSGRGDVVAASLFRTRWVCVGRGMTARRSTRRSRDAWVAVP